MKNFKGVSLVIGVLTMSLLASYIAFAWTEPSVSPPGGNVDTPLNTGTTAQTKNGSLSVTMLYDTDDPIGEYFIDPYSPVSAILSGSVGIGVTSTNAALQINGAISRQGTILDSSTTIAATEINLGEESTTINGYSTVLGGYWNTASGWGSTVSGGWVNTASDSGAFIGGGNSNTASGAYSFVGGGRTNTVNQQFSTISGGSSNTASGDHSVVAGGYSNTASGNYSVVAGGYSNTASGNYSWAGGRNMQLTSAADNTFVWGYSFSAVPISTPGAFIIYSGDVGIGTTTPSSILQLYDSAATSTITVGGVGSAGCFKVRDSDDAGWSYGILLNGAITWSTTSCE